MVIEYLKKHEKASILVSILMIIVSILLIIRPTTFLTTVILIFGFGIVLEGLMRIIVYIFLPKEEKIYSYDILEGIFSILAGILILAWKERVMAVFPLLISFWIVIKSMLKIQFSFQLKNLDEKSWIGVFISGILTLIFGLIIFFNPWGTVITLTVLSGIMLLITGIVELCSSIYWLYHFRKV